MRKIVSEWEESWNSNKERNEEWWIKIEEI